MLLRHRQSEAAREFARLRLGHVTEGKAQHVELLVCGAKQEIALVAIGIARTVKSTPATGKSARCDIVAGRHHARAQLLRGGEQILELDGLVAGNARHRRFTRDIAFREAIDHRRLEAALVIENVMRNADAFRDLAGIVDILPGAAGALAVGRSAMIVKLQGDADDIVAFGLQQGRHDRGIDTPRHGNDHAGVFRPPLNVQAVVHPSYYREGRHPRNRAKPRKNREFPAPGRNCRDPASRAEPEGEISSVTPFKILI